MARGTVGRVRAFVERYFPERQFYHRSHGEVRFISLSAANQIGLVFVTLLFLAWVAFASVNVVFKEQIISAKERNLVAMQQHYEVRLSEMQRAYDEVNQLLTIAAERFSSKATELETYHQQLGSYIDREAELQRKLSELRTELKISFEPPRGQGTTAVLMRAIDLPSSPMLSRELPSPKDVELADLTQSLRSVVDARTTEHRGAAKTTDKISAIGQRVDQLNVRHERLMTELEERTAQSIAEMESFIGSTGITVRRFVTRFEERRDGVGGPLIDLADMGVLATDPLEYDAVERRQLRIDAQLDRLDALSKAMAVIPLAVPVVDAHRMTSNFGPRRDPFTRKFQFHGGIDFAGPRGTAILSTQAGTVTIAGWHGAYGKLVELDHGYGFRTRYAHMSKVAVSPGQQVQIGDKLGEIGSTGRSTGPHLHYEIWVDGKVEDPASFIQAGEYVFKG